MKALFKLLLLLLLLFFLAPALASFFYYNGNSPSYFRDQSDPYEKGNLYNKANPNNPYSVYQDPYNQDSLRNNTVKYGYTDEDEDNHVDGTLGQQLNGTNSITDPYKYAGNPYQKENAKDPYSKDNITHPYGDFKDVYNEESGYNNPQYAPQMIEESGYFEGALEENVTNKGSVLNPYSQYGNPYARGSVANPYSHSPYEDRNW